MDDITAQLLAGRKSAGLTQDEVSKATGIPRTRLAKLETGSAYLRAVELIRLSGVYGIEWYNQLAQDRVENVAGDIHFFSERSGVLCGGVGKVSFRKESVTCALCKAKQR